MVGGLVVQVVAVLGPVTDRIGALGPPIYVASTAARPRGDRRPTVGSRDADRRARRGCNLVAIVANGGYMPADPGAIAALGQGDPTTYSNSAILGPRRPCEPLTDIFALPPWVPFANVFSIGDVAHRRRRGRRDRGGDAPVGLRVSIGRPIGVAAPDRRRVC